MARSGLHSRKRSGVTMVEFVFVMVIFFMFLFGILEYARFVFMKQMIAQAAREGARFAVVNTREATVETETLARVQQAMAGTDTNVKNYSVKVYKANAAGANIGLAKDAQFGEYVAVEITGEFNPILPGLLFMSGPIQLQTKSLMYSEAN